MRGSSITMSSGRANILKKSKRVMVGDMLPGHNACIPIKTVSGMLMNLEPQLIQSTPLELAVAVNSFPERCSRRYRCPDPRSP